MRPLLFASLLLAARGATPTVVPIESPPSRLDRIRANDNRVAAGRQVGDTLTIALELRDAEWRPGNESGRIVRMYAFAEAGKAPSIPGPLVRVRAGTTVSATVRNLLDRRAVLHGLHDHDGVTADSFALAPGESRTVRFVARTPGTQFYHARTVTGARVFSRYDDSQLAGALIVDSASAPADPRERIFVITAWDDSVRAPGYVTDYFQVYAINGRSWPATERFTYALGDTVRWRVINASDHAHPMHLHGFFFDVLSKGSSRRDTVYAASARRSAVTEFMRTGSTYAMQWVAERPGHWLWHCHMINHIDQRLRDDGASHAAMNHDDVANAMSGLVTAITITDNRQAAASATTLAPANAAWRPLRVYITERAHIADSTTFLSYVLQRGTTAPAADSVLPLSSTLVLRQGEPTEITLVNRAARPTAVHWHGIELDSYYDGIAGWSGVTGARTARMIAPGDSFKVRLAVPRAGTYIYHTHADESVQLDGGLYGALVVLPRGVASRDTSERTVVLTEWGPRVEVAAGDGRADAIELRAGVTHRLRIVGIVNSNPMRVRLVDDTTAVPWRQREKDASPVTAADAGWRAAPLFIGAGETYDYEIRRDRPGRLMLEVVLAGNPNLGWRVPILVK